MGRDWMRIAAYAPDPWLGGGVYALYLGGALVYVGHTGNFRYRILAHRRRFEFDVVKVACISDRRERQYLERRLLRRLRPPFNRSLPTHLEWAWWYRGASAARRAVSTDGQTAPE